MVAEHTCSASRHFRWRACTWSTMLSSVSARLSHPGVSCPTTDSPSHGISSLYVVVLCSQLRVHGDVQVRSAAGNLHLLALFKPGRSKDHLDCIVVPCLGLRVLHINCGAQLLRVVGKHLQIGSVR